MHRFIFLLAAALVFSACTKASSVTTPVVGPSTLDSVVSDEALQAAGPSRRSRRSSLRMSTPSRPSTSRLGGHAAAAIGGNEALAALETDLKAIFGRLLGPDLTAAGYAIAWLAHEEDALGLVLRGDLEKSASRQGAQEGRRGRPPSRSSSREDRSTRCGGERGSLKAMVAVRKGSVAHF